MRSFVKRYRAAGPSLTVLRTTTGTAQSVAIALDKARWPEVVGTISGDDTIFIATQERPRAAPPARAPAFPLRPLRASHDQTVHTGAKPIVLAYSGGLDTSFCVPWLAENYGRPIIT